MQGRRSTSTCVMRVSLFFPKWGASRGSAVSSTRSEAESESCSTVTLCGCSPTGNMSTLAAQPSGTVVAVAGIIFSMSSTSFRRSAQYWAIPPSWCAAVGGTLQQYLQGARFCPRPRAEQAPRFSEQITPRVRSQGEQPDQKVAGRRHLNGLEMIVRIVEMPVLAALMPSSSCGTIGTCGTPLSTVIVCRSSSFPSSVVPYVALPHDIPPYSFMSTVPASFNANSVFRWSPMPTKLLSLSSNPL